MSSDLGSPSGSSDRSLPAFTKTRDASGSSDEAESRVSDKQSIERRHPPPNQNLEPFLHQTPGRNQPWRSYKTEPGNHEAVTSTKSRSSGGFLLDPAVAPSRLSFLSRSKDSSANAKGKSRRDGSGLLISKRRNRGSHMSSGSSPLANKVSTVEHDADVREGSPVQDGSDLQNPMISTARDMNTSPVQYKNQTTSSSSDPPLIGYETDPMQIVNLALSLSEGRRRQASGIRLASAESGTRRSISIGNGTNSRTSRAQNSLGQYLNSGRQFSRNISPRAAGTRQVTPVKTYDKPSGTIGSYLQPIAVDEADLEFQDDLYDVSEATKTRVLKAKEHFELLYEHRRLLAHLPPLRGSKEHPRTSDVEGRAYNPLQYARNRKVRLPEKRPIENDSEAWHDVQHVRSWVDAIIEGHTERRTNPDECIRLPELDHLHAEVNQENQDPVQIDSASSIKGKRETDQGVKPRRPRSDWVISPGDLLADVYWLEQGLNKTKVEDRDGHKIYPWNIELKYTGWRNRTPAHGQGSQQSSHAPELADSENPKLSAPVAPPDLPTFTSAGRKGKHRGRGRRREARTQSDSESGNSDSVPQTRRKRLRKSLMMSIGRSSTSDSGDEQSLGARTRTEKRENEESAADSGALDHYMRKMLDRDAMQFSHSLTSSKPRSSIERSRSNTNTNARLRSQTPSGRERRSSRKRRESHRPLGSLRDSLEKRRHSRPSLDFERPTRPSLEYDTTAPSSPSAHQFPSIAINLSPPPSRSPSPTKKALHSRINPFRDRNHGKHRNGIDNFDFADSPLLVPERRKSGEIEKDSLVFHFGSRDTSPMTKNVSRSSDASITREESQRSNSTVSKTSAKALYVPESASRIRGIFKGGRIAELVGNEVSRVGDFIWKREVPTATRTSSSASSTRSPPGSDNEEEVRANGNVLKKPPHTHASHFPPSLDSNDKSLSSNQSRSAGAADKTAYFMSNLPSFTSPFQKDREAQEERGRAIFLTPESSPLYAQRAPDHISQAAAHHRSISRSSRLDRLAPPKLNISRSSSPVGLPDNHREAYNFGKTLSLTDPTKASQGLNDALSRPVTGLASLKASRSGTDLTRNWDPSARQDTYTERPSAIITAKDIARARALLLSSGAKGRQISLQAQLIRPQPPQFLVDTLDSPPSPSTMHFLRVPRKEEHYLAARNLICTISTLTTTFHSSLDHFTRTTTPELHTSLQALDDLVENTLTPRVRAAADESAELSMKLTTTSTLAVKGLHDVIEGAMRRRRRGPVRWLKRFGYGIVEWLVVGLLWGIWLVVSAFRVGLGMLRWGWSVGRWLLWLD